MSSATLVIARLTFHEAARRKILIVALLLGIVFLVVYGIGTYYIRQDLLAHADATIKVVANPNYNILAQAGLYVVNFLTIMMTVLTSVDTLSGEIASGTIHTLLSKPVRRWEIVLGKWLGFMAMLTLYLLFMAGGILAIIYVITGYAPPNIPIGLAIMWLNIAFLLNLTLLGGTRFSTLTNGVLVFAAYGIAFIGGWIEQIGAILRSDVAVKIGIVSSLLIPSEALWKRAAYEMRSMLIDALGVSPFSSVSVPSTAMIIYAAVYTLILLILVVWNFSNRDL